MEAKLTTRERILKSALVLFEAQGVDGTTVADIRKAAEVSNGSFFHAFPNKEALAIALYLTILEDYHAHMTAELYAETSAKEGISVLIRAHVAWVMDNKPAAHFLFDQARTEWLREGNAELRDRNEAFRDGLARWYIPRMSDGSLKRLPPEVLISQIIGPAQILCRRWLAGRDKKMPGTHLLDLIECAHAALIAPE